MKILLKLLIAGLMLLATGSAQELNRRASKPAPAAEVQTSREQMIATGSPQRPAPIVQPKALPRLNPSLGEIARRARAARAEAPKAQVVVADEAPPQK